MLLINSLEMFDGIAPGGGASWSYKGVDGPIRKSQFISLLMYS